MGRPSKYTPEREEQIVKALRAGNTRTAAVSYAGIDYVTFLNWLKRYSSFSEAVEKAEAQAEVSHVANIARAAQDGTWQASAWWLERRRHQDWRKREDVNVGNQDGKPLKHEVVITYARNEALPNPARAALPPGTGDPGGEAV